MEDEILLAQFRALRERTPDFEEYLPSSRDHQVWMGQVRALIMRWDSSEVEGLKSLVTTMNNSNQYVRRGTASKITQIVEDVIADLEIKVPDKGKVAFAAGEVYSFYSELNVIIQSAEETIFIIDPYIDQTIFTQYLTAKKPGVTVRLLSNKLIGDILPVAEKYNQEYGGCLELRKTRTIHDRVIFVDGTVCYVVGGSIKDAAKAKPTYLAPLSPDVAVDKLSSYESIWSSANPL